jgi:uracil-DNA glycosylase family 4
VTKSLRQIEQSIVRCRRCPELRAYCADVAAAKRRAFRGETYWGRPVPGFGDPAARIVIVGLAPGAHGANRTGRMFTGDRSGDFLYAALHRAGLANRAESVRRGDGLALTGAYITAAIRCAPPANRPTPAQRERCLGHLLDELALLRPRVLVALGAIAWGTALAGMAALGTAIPRPRPRFAHGAETEVGGARLLGCYHPSQQNTFTGRLTEEMIDAILARAVARAT